MGCPSVPVARIVSTSESGSVEGSGGNLIEGSGHVEQARMAVAIHRQSDRRVSHQRLSELGRDVGHWIHAKDLPNAKTVAREMDDIIGDMLCEEGEYEDIESVVDGLEEEDPEVLICLAIVDAMNGIVRFPRWLNPKFVAALKGPSDWEPDGFDSLFSAEFLARGQQDARLN